MRFLSPLRTLDLIRDGKLYLEKPDRIIEIAEVWPEPVARASTWERPQWHSCNPKVRLDARTSPYAEFFAAIPASVRSVVARFPAWHWELLCGVAASTAVLDLLQANPALGLMSQIYWQFQASDRRSVAHAVALASQRRHEIAAALGFPAAKWSVRVLAKIPPERLYVRDLLTVRRLMNDPESVKMLRHIERLDGPLLSLLHYPRLREVMTWQLINELARDQCNETAAKIVLQLLELDDYRHRLPRSPEPGYTAVTEIQDAWNWLQESRRPRARPEQQCISFPKAPLLEDPGITPLLTRESIILESNEQGNCVNTYIAAAKHGRVYLFKVTYPERATLAVKQKNGRWHCAELKGPRNRPVRPATRSYVRRWLATANTVDDPGKSAEAIRFRTIVLRENISQP